MSTNRRPLDPLQLQLVGQLARARHAAVTLTAVDEVVLAPLDALRAQVGDAFLTKYGVVLEAAPFFLKAAAAALRQVPALARQLDGDEWVDHTAADLSVAVVADGVRMMPVVRGCDGKAIGQLATELAALRARVATGALEVAETQGGVISLEALVAEGPACGTPALNAPQSAALVCYPARPAAVVEDGRLVARPVMRVALAHDERVVSAAEAAAFLTAFRAALARPLGLLLTV